MRAIFSRIQSFSEQVNLQHKNGTSSFARRGAYEEWESSGIPHDETAKMEE
jgi:hypothetical protein